MVFTFGRPQAPEEAGLDQLIACFEGLKHPPAGNAGLHDLHELLIAPRTVLSGGQGTAHIAAAAKEPFLCGFVKLANGLPSHDTSAACSTPSCSAPCSSDLWPGSPKPSKALSPRRMRPTNQGCEQQKLIRRSFAFVLIAETRDPAGFRRDWHHIAGRELGRQSRGESVKTTLPQTTETCD
jgi:hypothetical protein